MRKNLYRILFLLMALLPASTMAQNFSEYNWYFGSAQRDMRFSRSTQAVTIVANQSPALTGIGGSAVASNPITGDLIFYTDGNAVIDASHQSVPQTGLSGNTSRNQAVAIARKQDAKGQYYIFYLNVGGNAIFSVFDSAQVGNAVTFGQPPLGDITIKNQALGTLTAAPGFPTGTVFSEGMITVYDQINNAFWLILHQTGTNNYHFVKADKTGLSYPGLVSVGLIQNVANLRYNASSKRIAVSPQEANRDVEILSITFPTAPATLPALTSSPLLNSSSTVAATQAVYDAEFSPNGQYLYVSFFGAGAASGDLLQYDLTQQAAVPLPSPVSILPAPVTESYGLQIGPDSVIYHLYQSGAQVVMGAINRPDSPAVAVNYNAIAFPGNFGGQQFPAFAPADSLKMKIYFDAIGLCANSPTSFFPTVQPGADSLVWDFGGGATSSDWSPVHTFETAGTIPVKVTAYLNGQAKDTTQSVVIKDFQTQITLVQDTTACSCELPFPKKPAASCGTFTVSAQVQGGGNIQWYGPSGLLAGQTSATLTKVDSAGYYYLVVTDPGNGCSVSAGVNIKEYGVQDQRANIWYFGNNAGIDFNPLFDTPPGAAQAISNPVMNAPEGTSTISDRNGQVIFFTDGVKVWDRTFAEISTPPTIGGDQGSTQSALIIPVPGDETLYYIFTTQQIYGTEKVYRLSYSLFDLKKGTNGQLVKQNVTLFTKSTERITGNGQWLIAHEYGNNSFRAYRISQAGIGNPVISGIGSDHSSSFAETGQGYMKLGAQNRLAVALSIPGQSNVVEVFDFADSTGTVSNFRSLNLNNTAGQVYGVEFGAGGNKLYATLSNATSTIYEFAFDTLGMATEVDGPPKMSATSYPERLGAIQQGPDGQLYVAVDGKKYLGVITVNPQLTQISTFNATQFPLLATTDSRLGLPNFIQIISDPIQGPSISVTGTCLGDSTTFAGTGTDPIDTYVWQVTQAGSVITSSTEQTFKFLFATPGLYDVVLQISNRCGLNVTLTEQFRIYGVPPDPSATFALCNAPMMLDANPTNAPDLTYLWGTGATTKTISVSTAGNYNVTLTNTAGCTTDGVIQLFPSLTTIDFGPDQTVCSEPGTGTTLNTNINIQAHSWTINNAPVAGNNGPTQFVDLSLPGKFEYAVAFTDPLSTCTVRDTIIFIVNQSPVISAIGNTIACAANNGQITLTITQPTTPSVLSYTVAGGAFTESQNNLSAGVYNIPAPPSLAIGLYSIQVSDQVSGCFTNTSATVSNAAVTVDTPPTIQACGPTIVPVDVTGPAPGPADFYRVFRATDPPNSPPVIPNTPYTVSLFSTTPPLPFGDYIVEVNIGGCPSFSQITSIVQGDTLANAQIDISSICSTSQVQASATGATSFVWSSSPSNGFTPTADPSIVTVSTGQYQLTVTMDDANPAICPARVTQTVAVDQVTSNFNFDACTDPVILIAAPTNNSSPLNSYFYSWTLNSSAVGTGQQFDASTPGAGPGNYILRMQSTISGCTFDSPSKNVQFLGPLEATITTVNVPCAGEGSVFALLATTNRSVLSYQWSLKSATIPGETTAQLNGQNQAGLYAVKVSDGICEAEGTLNVSLLPTTPSLLPSIALICPEHPDVTLRSVVLDPGSSFASYLWSDGSTDPTFTATSANVYVVRLINAFGCETVDQTDVQEECEPFLTAPNAFRPTSAVDANTMFGVFSLFIDESDFQVYIFNRWGEMVFASNERDFKWNGGYKNNQGQELPAGTYTYVVKYKSSYRPEEGTKEKRGGVLLMR